MGDFGASSSAFLKPVRRFWRKFFSDFGANSLTICTKYSSDFRVTCSDNPTRVAVVTARKKIGSTGHP